MNTTLDTIVKSHIPELAGETFSFVKFNTAGSPLRASPKVLFFCFVGAEPTPRYCLKTVRAARDNAVVAESFDNLKELGKLAGNAQMFARAIWSGEVGGVMWSIEEAVPGRRITPADVPVVVEAYTQFAKAAGIVREMSANEKAKELIASLDINEGERTAALERWRSLDTGGTVAISPQHGDLTLDNTLIDGARVSFVDGDWFMREGIAGFDLFHLFIRIPATSATSVYLRTYATATGLNRDFSAADVFLWHLEERLLKQRQGAPRDMGGLIPAYERIRSHIGIA